MIPRYSLFPGYQISRVIKGGWHLAGGHGRIEPEQAMRDMAQFVEAGITTFDCADIYTGVEALIGQFRARYPEHAKAVQIHTKFVPNLSALERLDRREVEAAIDRSRQRLGLDQIPLVQFHWWDYTVPRYIEIAQVLNELRVAGKIAAIGVTNFSTLALRQIIAAGVPVVAHQLQYSLLDDRPEHGMVEYCRAHRISLLCYGTIAGGFLSDRWLGAPDPGATLQNRSLVKYRLIIEEFGGWELFQHLLGTLDRIAKAHACDIGSVAIRLILDRPGVAAAIVGATSSRHLQAHLSLNEIEIRESELNLLKTISELRAGPSGDVYELERYRTGPHGQIMRYELNE